MTDVYGGLFLENLVKEDKYFELQMKLFEKGIIQGVQLRVAHPLYYTPGITDEQLPRILSRLPGNLKLFIHCGAENVGVDFGENLDECGIFANQKITDSWSEWNKKTLDWASQVAYTANTKVVVHPGYGENFNDSIARNNIIKFLKKFKGENIALENVPPVANKQLWEQEIGQKVDWNQDQYWGFGGIPDDMAMLLKELGTGWKCLIDFTHLIVTVNQANGLDDSLLQNCKDIEKVVENYFNLPHCSICHFSGIPPRDCLVANHDYLSAPVLSPVRDGIRQMDAVCLEISFRPDELDVTQREIETFREQYLA